jgi:serine/threonine protein kinase
MEGGDLSSRVDQNKPLEESHMKLIFFQLAQAIQYLHQQTIVHRDIKVGPYMFHTKTLILNVPIILVFENFNLQN